jgi:ribosomal protein S18 acetylase RimI-like enzyme
MTTPGFEIRRARRTDFTAVMQLLAASGEAVPPPDRATLRRFRNLVADLGTDFYLLLVDATPAGLVHVTYARQLARPPRAVLDQLVVAAPFRRRGVGGALLAFVCGRARRRGCAAIWCAVPPADAAARAFLAAAGLQPRGEWLGLDLVDG